MTHSGAISLLVLVLLSLLRPGAIAAQGEGAEHDHQIAQVLAPFDTTRPDRAARLFIIDRLSRDSRGRLGQVIAYTDRRVGEGWLGPIERLLLYFLLEEARLGSLDVVDRLLSETGRVDRAGLDDGLRQMLVTEVHRARRTIVRYLASGIDDRRHADFLLLTLQSLSLRGVRTVDELNDRVDDFISADSADRRSVLADRYLRRSLQQGGLGVGLIAGYDAGRFIGTEERPGEAVHGPRLGLRLHADRFVAELALLARRIGAPTGPVATVEGSMHLGIDLVARNPRIRPYGGIHYWSIGEGSEESLRPLGGLEVGSLLLFDDPPHLFLGIGGELQAGSFTGRTERSSLALWSVRLSLSLMNRRYTIR